MFGYHSRQRVHNARKHMILRVRAKSDQGLGSDATVYVKILLGCTYKYVRSMSAKDALYLNQATVAQ